jgi:hypothetical protein
MANERIPDDHFPNDPYRSPPTDMTDSEYTRAQRMDNELQADPELAEGPTSTGKIAAYALGIAILLGAVFYGMSYSPKNDQAANPPASQSAQTQPASPNNASPNNATPGVTTGAATNRPTPPANAPAGTEVDRSAGDGTNSSAPPPAGKNNNTN